MQFQRKASIFIYILFLINIFLVLGLVVYNNSVVISNNISTGSNVYDNFLNIKNKGNISINSVKQYNSNGNGYLDNISCPTNISFSGSTSSGTNISTQIRYSTGSIYCYGNYSSEEFRIYFNNNFTDFTKAYYSDNVDNSNNIVDLNESGGIYTGDSNFTDSDLSLLSFNSDGIGGGDLYDDDFNSDDYRVTSTGTTYFPNNYVDDDVIPRKNIFGYVYSGIKNENIFWNNYKTNNFIDNNANNTDNINVKIGDVENAYIDLSIYNAGDNSFDLKILEFDKNAYTNENTLLPIVKYFGNDLNDYAGYIQTNTGVLSISKIITGNEFKFNFKNKDYGIFLSNNSSSNIVFKLSAETTTGTGIYINPIDDSGNLAVEVMSNHITQGAQGNYMGENFIAVGLK